MMMQVSAYTALVVLLSFMLTIKPQELTSHPRSGQNFSNFNADRKKWFWARILLAWVNEKVAIMNYGSPHYNIDQ